MNAGETDHDSTEIARDSLYVVLTYFVFAFAIFILGRYFWWLGFICFAIFAIQVVGRLLLSGVVLLIAGLAARLLFRFIRTWGLHPTKFDDIVGKATDLVWLNLIVGTTECILLVITILLGLSFFW